MQNAVNRITEYRMAESTLTPLEQYTRAQELHDAGTSINQIAKIIGRPPSIVHGWVTGKSKPRGLKSSSTPKGKLVKARKPKVKTLDDEPEKSSARKQPYTPTRNIGGKRRDNDVNPENLTDVALTMIQRGSVAVDRLSRVSDNLVDKIDRKEGFQEDADRLVQISTIIATVSSQVAKVVIEAKKARMATTPIEEAELEAAVEELANMTLSTTNEDGEPLTTSELMLEMTRNIMHHRHTVSSVVTKQVLTWLLRHGPKYVPDDEKEVAARMRVLSQLGINPKDLLTIAEYADPLEGE